MFPPDIGNGEIALGNYLDEAEAMSRVEDPRTLPRSNIDNEHCSDDEITEIPIDLTTHNSNLQVDNQRPQNVANFDGTVSSSDQIRTSERTHPCCDRVNLPVNPLVHDKRMQRQDSSNRQTYMNSAANCTYMSSHPSLGTHNPFGYPCYVRSPVPHVTMNGHPIPDPINLESYLYHENGPVNYPRTFAASRSEPAEVEEKRCAGLKTFSYFDNSVNQRRNFIVSDPMTPPTVTSLLTSSNYAAKYALKTHLVIKGHENHYKSFGDILEHSDEPNLARAEGIRNPHSSGQTNNVDSRNPLIPVIELD